MIDIFTLVIIYNIIYVITRALYIGKTTRTAEVHQKYVVQGDDVCDFENGMCHYTQDASNDFDWTRRYGGTPSGNTGPETDHTTNRLGVFLYIEASSPRVEGDKARLMTKFFSATQEQQCLSFFLHMHSDNKTMMGELNIYLNDDVSENQVLLHKAGGQAVNDWTNIQMKFKPTGKYQIIFEGIRGAGYQGDIALDDISFSNKDCSVVPLRSNTKSNSFSTDKCEDTSDRENRYCAQWKAAGFCSSQKKHMNKFCRKSCSYC